MNLSQNIATGEVDEVDRRMREMEAQVIGQAELTAHTNRHYLNQNPNTYKG